MKKAMPYAIALLAAMLAAFLCGFYIGRGTNRYPVQVSALPSNTQETVATDTANPAESTEGQAVEKININTASAAMLQTLPGIGEILAQRIIDYREEYGPFTDLAGLLKVEGIGEKKLEAILDFATVGG